METSAKLFERFGGAPTARNGITLEVNVDSAFGLLQQLGMGSLRVLIGARYRLIGGNRGAAGLSDKGEGQAQARPHQRGGSCNSEYRQLEPNFAGETGVYARFQNLSAHGMKYFQFGPSVCPPSCWRQANWPLSSPSNTGGIFSDL